MKVAQYIMVSKGLEQVAAALRAKDKTKADALKLVDQLKEAFDASFTDNGRGSSVAVNGRKGEFNRQHEKFLLASSVAPEETIIGWPEAAKRVLLSENALHSYLSKAGGTTLERLNGSVALTLTRTRTYATAEELTAQQQALAAAASKPSRRWTAQGHY